MEIIELILMQLNVPIEQIMKLTQPTTIEYLQCTISLIKIMSININFHKTLLVRFYQF